MVVVFALQQVNFNPGYAICYSLPQLSTRSLLIMTAFVTLHTHADPTTSVITKHTCCIDALDHSCHPLVDADPGKPLAWSNSGAILLLS